MFLVISLMETCQHHHTNMTTEKNKATREQDPIKAHQMSCCSVSYKQGLIFWQIGSTESMPNQLLAVNFSNESMNQQNIETQPQRRCRRRRVTGLLNEFGRCQITARWGACVSSGLKERDDLTFLHNQTCSRQM